MKSVFKSRRDTTRRDTTRHDATRRVATRRDATRRDATRHDPTRHDATRHDATRQVINTCLNHKKNDVLEARGYVDRVLDVQLFLFAKISLIFERFMKILKI